MVRNAWEVAVHEAGHAVTADRLGLPVIRVQLGGSTVGFDGCTYIRDHDRARVADWLPVLLAGLAAEREILGYEITSRPHDRSDASRITDALVGVDHRQHSLLMTTAQQQAQRTVRAHRPPILKLAAVLLDAAARTGDASDSLDVSISGDELVTLLGGPAVAILRTAI